MAFLVYFFVLLVAGASVLFGLDWTQAPLNPPPYATPPAQSASVAPGPAAKGPANSAAVKPAAPSLAVAKTTDKATDKAAVTAQAPVPVPTAAPLDQATQAQASATPADTTASVPAASCNVSACSAAYRSFRATDCTYQPMSGERRLCTKSGSTGKVAAVAHPRNARRAEPRVDYRDRQYYDRRDSYDRRDAYDDRRGGWGLGGLFGGGGDY